METPDFILVVDCKENGLDSMMYIMARLGKNM